MTFTSESNDRPRSPLQVPRSMRRGWHLTPNSVSSAAGDPAVAAFVESAPSAR
jgi:hypothetical protein